jgi:hypothetical protein
VSCIRAQFLLTKIVFIKQFKQEYRKMKSKIKYSMTVGLLLGFLINSAALAEQNFPEITEQGLHKLSDTDLSLVYAKPDVDLSVYNKVWLVDATVAFKKNWRRDQNRSRSKVSANDMERIKTGLAGLFKEVFTEKLAAAGHDLATEAAEDVLIVRPAIVNLDVAAPDVQTATRTYSLTESAGEMTLYVELYDSVTGDILGKALDRRKDRDRGYLQWQTSVSNKAAANRILNVWADTLVGALDDARGASAGKTGSKK